MATAANAAAVLVPISVGPSLGPLHFCVGESTVGRSDQCSHVINDPRISRSHFVLELAVDLRAHLICKGMTSIGVLNPASKWMLLQQNERAELACGSVIALLTDAKGSRDLIFMFQQAIGPANEVAETPPSPAEQRTTLRSPGETPLGIISMLQKATKLRLDSVVSVISGNIERLSCSYRWQGEARELGVEIDGATWRMPALAGDSDEIWAQLFGLCHALAASDRTCHVTQLSRQSASFLVDAKPKAVGPGKPALHAGHDRRCPGQFKLTRLLVEGVVIDDDKDDGDYGDGVDLEHDLELLRAAARCEAAGREVISMQWDGAVLTGVTMLSDYQCHRVAIRTLASVDGVSLSATVDNMVVATLWAEGDTLNYDVAAVLQAACRRPESVEDVPELTSIASSLETSACVNVLLRSLVLAKTPAPLKELLVWLNEKDSMSSQRDVPGMMLTVCVDIKAVEAIALPSVVAIARSSSAPFELLSSILYEESSDGVGRVIGRMRRSTLPTQECGSEEASSDEEDEEEAKDAKTIRWLRAYMVAAEEQFNENDDNDFHVDLSCIAKQKSGAVAAESVWVAKYEQIERYGRGDVRMEVFPSELSALRWIKQQIDWDVEMESDSDADESCSDADERGSEDDSHAEGRFGNSDTACVSDGEWTVAVAATLDVGMRQLLVDPSRVWVEIQGLSGPLLPPLALAFIDKLHEKPAVSSNVLGQRLGQLERTDGPAHQDELAALLMHLTFDAATLGSQLHAIMPKLVRQAKAAGESSPSVPLPNLLDGLCLVEPEASAHKTNAHVSSALEAIVNDYSGGPSTSEARHFVKKRLWYCNIDKDAVLHAANLGNSHSHLAHPLLAGIFGACAGAMIDAHRNPSTIRRVVVECVKPEMDRIVELAVGDADNGSAELLATLLRLTPLFERSCELAMKAINISADKPALKPMLVKAAHEFISHRVIPMLAAATSDSTMSAKAYRAFLGHGWLRCTDFAAPAEALAHCPPEQRANLLELVSEVLVHHSAPASLPSKTLDAIIPMLRLGSPPSVFVSSAKIFKCVLSSHVGCCTPEHFAAPAEALAHCPPEQRANLLELALDTALHQFAPVELKMKTIEAIAPFRHTAMETWEPVPRHSLNSRVVAVPFSDNGRTTTGGMFNRLCLLNGPLAADLAIASQRWGSTQRRDATAKDRCQRLAEIVVNHGSDNQLATFVDSHCSDVAKTLEKTHIPPVDRGAPKLAASGQQAVLNEYNRLKHPFVELYTDVTWLHKVLVASKHPQAEQASANTRACAAAIVDHFTRELTSQLESLQAAHAAPLSLNQAKCTAAHSRPELVLSCYSCGEAISQGLAALFRLKAGSSLLGSAQFLPVIQRLGSALVAAVSSKSQKHVSAFIRVPPDSMQSFSTIIEPLHAKRSRDPASEVEEPAPKRTVIDLT